MAPPLLKDAPAMLRPLALLLAVSLLAVYPAEAAPALEQARAASRSARQQVGEVRGRQMGMRTELNQVAAQIEALKAQQKRGADLESALRRSQELSGALAEAAQQLSRAEADAEQQHLSLLAALGAELDRVHAQLERSEDRAQRAQLIARMRSLRQEREQVRALLPAAKVPALESSGSDDPEDLLEQADMLRDSEDKLRERMRLLQERVKELRAERELDRRMSDFQRDESIFDDHQGGRLSVVKRRELSRATHPPLFGGPENAADVEASAPSSGFGNASEPAPDRTQSPPGSDTGGASGLTHQGTITQIAQGADMRPHLGGMDRRGLERLGTRDIEKLEAEQQKLGKLAEELDQRANKLEERARE